MESELKFEISPVTTRDEKTGLYYSYVPDFPQASASGTSKAESEFYLMEVFGIMLKENISDVIGAIAQRIVEHKEAILFSKELTSDYRQNEGKTFFRLATPA